MTSGHEEWDDERLAAAFAARAARAGAPSPELVPATLDAMRSTERPRFPFTPLGGLVGLAAAIVVAAVAVVGAGLLDTRPHASPTAPSSSIAASAPSVAAPSAAESASASLTNELTVGAAIAIRDKQSGDRELRVGGWLRGGVPVPCPFTSKRNPTLQSCPQPLPSIVEDVSDAGVGSLDKAPAGPWIRPSFALVDASPLPALGAGSPVASAPVEISVTGHFHDRRAALCSTDCGSTFVVDRIDSVGGVPQPVSTSYDLGISVEKGNTFTGIEIPPGSPADTFDRAVTGLGRGLTILSRRMMSTDGLIAAEPALAKGWAGVGTAEVVTALTTLDPGSGPAAARARTFLVPEGSPILYEMTAAEPVVAGNLPVKEYPDGLVSRVGEPVTVSEAIDHRDHALDDAEILVEGYGWEPGALSCIPAEPSQPVLDQCPSNFTWLSERVPAPVKGVGPTRPGGPAINLVIPPESVNLALLTTTPTATAVLGHFDDHRSASCPTGLVERCRRNFIVDAILDPGRLALDAARATTVHPAPSNVPRATASWAAAAAGLPEAERTNRLVSVFPVAVAALGALEPGGAGTEATKGVDTVWLVHFLDVGLAGTPVVRTRLVIDADPGKGAARVYDVIEAGLSRALAANP